ncbi:MAG: hypothetical protein K0S36_1358 [Nitrosospira multiformis]|jgi:hypothetical protein|nr:hypothetical protein [Nitrosospira multiformis]
MEANYSLRYIGDVNECEDYLAKHPEFKPGSPLPTLSKTYLPRFEQHKVFSPELFLNYKPPSPNPR